MKQYLKTLKVQRKEYIADALKRLNLSKDFLETEEGRLFEKQAINLFQNNLISVQNFARAKVGEFLANQYLINQYNARHSQIQNDKVVFDTPFGKRRIDAFWLSTRIAVESKMGYIYNNKHIKSQIIKDKYLIETEKISKVVWILFQDGSNIVKTELRRNNIEFIVGWNAPFPNLLVDYEGIIPEEDLLLGQNSSFEIFEDNFIKAVKLLLEFSKTNRKKLEEIKEINLSWEKHIAPVITDEAKLKIGLIEWINELIKKGIEVKSYKELSDILEMENDYKKVLERLLKFTKNSNKLFKVSESWERNVKHTWENRNFDERRIGLLKWIKELIENEIEIENIEEIKNLLLHKKKKA